MRTLLSSILLCTSLLHAEPSRIPSSSHFKVETLAEGIHDGMEIAPLPDGRIVIAEWAGQLKIWDPVSQTVSDYDSLDVVIGDGKTFAREAGLLGITADPDFAQNNYLYVFYSPPEEAEHRISRFTMRAEGLRDELNLLTYEQTRKDGTCHEGGSLAFGPDGNLYISAGDNTNPFHSDGKAPIDERDGRSSFDAQRSAANTNDLRGSILRIKPTETGYEIPEGNLFPEGTAKTRPEIYVMGTRNPWRISLDAKSGFLYWGEVGPDGAETNERGPIGYDEINQAREAGNFGWPYFIGENIAYADYDFSKDKAKKAFDPEKPINDSSNNSGLKKLPAAQPAFRTLKRSCNCAGPVIYSDLTEGAWPESMDKGLVTYDWNNGHFSFTKLADNGEELFTEPFLRDYLFIHPSDVELGPDNALYVLEFGSTWGQNTDGRLLRVSYSEQELMAPKKAALDPRLAGMDQNHPGTALLKDSLCLSCHQSQVKSVGPSYLEVADKYRGESGAAAALIEKIVKGGAGVWGPVPMPPQPQYNEEQLSQIVDSILSVGAGHQE